MKITINTETPLSAQEREVLRTLLGESEPSVDGSPAAAKESSEDSSPAPRRRATKKASAPKKPDPEPDEDEADDDDAGEEEEESLFDQAVAAATKLASSGQGAKVRKALTKIGVKKVSDIKSDKDLKKFLELV